MNKKALLIGLFLGTQILFSQNTPKYKNSKLPVDERVQDLLSRMTVEEKFWQMFMIPGDLSDGAHAVANILFGDKNPAGRLPITFPVFEGQLPLVYNHKPTGRSDDYTNLNGVPLFPFGYGLSYSTFEYSNLRFDKKQLGKSETTKVYCTIKNTSKVDGDEVVQLYVRDLLSSIAQPIKQLKGFQRISLKAGESKEISFEINKETLQMLNEDMKWVVEPGDFRIMIGASSRDIRLREIITVTE